MPLVRLLDLFLTVLFILFSVLNLVCVQPFLATCLVIWPLRVTLCSLRGWTVALYCSALCSSTSSCRCPARLLLTLSKWRRREGIGSEMRSSIGCFYDAQRWPTHPQACGSCYCYSKRKLMYGCFACTYIYKPCAQSTQRGQKPVMGLLELELQTVVSCYVGNGYRIWVVWKSCQCC